MTSYEYQATSCYNIQQHLRKRWYIEISNKCDKHLMVSNSSCFPWILNAGLHTIALFIELFNCVGLTCSLVYCDISCFCKHKKQSHKNMRWWKFFTWWVQKQFDWQKHTHSLRFSVILFKRNFSKFSQRKKHHGKSDLGVLFTIFHFQTKHSSYFIVFSR